MTTICRHIFCGPDCAKLRPLNLCLEIDINTIERDLVYLSCLFISVFFFCLFVCLFVSIS